MDIYKVLKKQKKSYTRFMLSMGFIFLLLPLVLYITRRFDLFFIIYLCVIEALIFISVMIRYNEDYLKFEVDHDKLMVSICGGRIKYRILSSKVVIVHTIPEEQNFNIILVTKSQFRNKRIKVITQRVIDKYKGLEEYYKKINKPDDGYYYYFIIKKGGAKKYLLLDVLYKYCLDALFTENAVENIKQFRNSNKSRTS